MGWAFGLFLCRRGFQILCHLFPKGEVLDRLRLFGDGNGEGEVVGCESFLLVQFNPKLQGLLGLGQVGVGIELG